MVVASPHPPIDQARADHAVAFINSLTHTGDYSGKPFTLAEWQEHRIIRPIFGLVDEDGLRIIRTAFIFLPRKNGKTELCAAMVLLCLFGLGYRDAEIYSAASDREQAGRVFKAAVHMIRANPFLNKSCRIIRNRKQIIVDSTGNNYEALAADAGSHHGRNPKVVIYDELHTAKSRDQWAALESGMGTRTEPLFVVITTAGCDPENLERELFDYACKVDAGEVDDPQFLPLLYYADEDADWTDPKVWAEANPALGDFLKPEYIERQVMMAQRLPRAQNDVRRYHLNQHTEQAIRWLDVEMWDACNSAEDWPDLTGVPCWGGIDLSSKIDLTALVLVWKHLGKHYVKPFFWVPEDTDDKRERWNRQVYRHWIREGQMRSTPGGTVDYDFVLSDIDKLADEYKIQEIAIDRNFGLHQFAIDLQRDVGIEPIAFPMTITAMSPGCKQLEALLETEQIAHDGNPCLRWNIKNVCTATDTNENIRPDKKRSTEKIDGVVALVMALARMEHAAAPESNYATRGLITL